MKFKKIVSSGVVVFIFSLLFWRIIHDFGKIKGIHWGLQAKNTVPLVAFLLLGPFVNSLSWHLITESLGGKINFLDNIKIWTLSNAARFLPGSVWQYGGRIYLLSKKGVSKSFTTTALLMEAILNLTVGGVIILFFLSFWPTSISSLIQKTIVPILIAACFMGIFLTGNRVRLLENLTKCIFKNKAIRPSRINLAWLPIVLVSVTFQYILAGLTLLFVVSASGLTVPTENAFSLNALFFIGIYTTAWFVGYISFLAPSGLGIREASVAGLLLTLQIPLALGSLIAILFRMLQMVSEAIMVAILLLVKHPPRKPS